MRGSVTRLPEVLDCRFHLVDLQPQAGLVGMDVGPVGWLEVGKPVGEGRRLVLLIVLALPGLGLLAVTGSRRTLAVILPSGFERCAVGGEIVRLAGHKREGDGGGREQRGFRGQSVHHFGKLARSCATVSLAAGSVRRSPVERISRLNHTTSPVRRSTNDAKPSW